MDMKKSWMTKVLFASNPAFSNLNLAGQKAIDGAPDGGLRFHQKNIWIDVYTAAVFVDLLKET